MDGICEFDEHPHPFGADACALDGYWAGHESIRLEPMPQDFCMDIDIQRMHKMGEICSGDTYNTELRTDLALRPTLPLNTARTSYSRSYRPVLPATRVNAISKPRGCGQRLSQLNTWEAHRGTIKRLYIDEGKPLMEVMAIIDRDHGHRGTPKSYKSYLKKWNITKNCNSHEMTAIARKTLERYAVGNSSIFRVRGKQVDSREILRYFRRKGYQSLDEAISNTMYQESNKHPDFQCVTPNTSNVPRNGSTADMNWAISPVHGSEQLDSTQNSVINNTFDAGYRFSGIEKYRHFLATMINCASTSDPLSLRITTPQQLLIPERIFRSVNDFVCDSIDNELWEPTTMAIWTQMLN